MTTRTIATREQWLTARLELLEAEKELTRRSDEVARQREQLPWVPVEKDYRFDTDTGAASDQEVDTDTDDVGNNTTSDSLSTSENDTDSGTGSDGGSTIPNSIESIRLNATKLWLSVFTGSRLTKYASSWAGSRGSEPSLSYG